MVKNHVKNPDWLAPLVIKHGKSSANPPLSSIWVSQRKRHLKNDWGCPNLASRLMTPGIARQKLPGSPRLSGIVTGRPKLFRIYLGDTRHLVQQISWLLVGPPLWKIWKSVGIMKFPMEKCSKPSSRLSIVCDQPPSSLRSWDSAARHIQTTFCKSRRLYPSTSY